MVAIKFEKNPTLKSRLEKHVDGYIDRFEQIKKELHIDTKVRFIYIL